MAKIGFLLFFFVAQVEKGEKYYTFIWISRETKNEKLISSTYYDFIVFFFILF